MSQDAPEITTQQRFNRIHDDLDAIYLKAQKTGDRLQDEGTARTKAENVISLIAHSTTGDYNWCRKVCQDFLGMPEPIEPLLAVRHRLTLQDHRVRVLEEILLEAKEAVTKEATHEDSWWMFSWLPRACAILPVK